MGFGLSMLKKSISEDDYIQFDLFENFEENILSILIVFVMFLTLVVTIVYEMTHEMKFNRTIGFVLAAIYSVFIVVATFIEFKRAFFN